MDARYYTVLTALASEQSAKALARSLVNQRLAACVQVVPVNSIYRWRGEVVDTAEWRLDAKTTASSLADVMAVIRDLHPYEVPEIIATPIVDGNHAYLRWIDEETAR